MRWLLIGCYGLALVSLSLALELKQSLYQMPRFLRMRTESEMTIECQGRPAKLSDNNWIEWYMATKYDKKIEDRIKLSNKKGVNIVGRHLFIKPLTAEHTGVYYCKLNSTWGSGTEVQVFSKWLLFSCANLLRRSKMKDTLIILQGLLLAICVAALLLRNQTLVSDKTHSTSLPSTGQDGLAIESCAGGLYEDISVYAQPEGAEAPWEQD
uniref:Immunoglobulin domain-containing protein n=1 Tax=Myripristis murdjan TaxID=586833 RepID=A0A668ASA4_9TELE